MNSLHTVHYECCDKYLDVSCAHFLLYFMFDIDKCSVRLARREDREDLIEISKRIWDGHDYLPQIVDRWIAEPWFFVCEFEAKVIACLKLSEMPDNVIWFEGLRVHAKYQGKGVAKLMNRELLKFASGLKSQNPALSFEFCTYYKNVESLALTSKLGSVKVDSFYNLERRGVRKVLVPEIITDYGREIFAGYPDYLPLNWHAVHSSEASLDYIRKHATVFRTPNSIYLLGRVGEQCITFLEPPQAEIGEDLRYMQYFFGSGKRISATISRHWQSYLPLLQENKFYFWDDNQDQSLNMLVFKLPS